MKSIKVVLIFLLVTHFSCKSPYQKGENIYLQHCSNCHGKEGEGLRKLYPPITDELYEKYSLQLPCMIRYGLNDNLVYNGNKYTAAMPPNEILTDIDIVNLVNFLDWKYTTNKAFNSLADVKKKLDDCN